MTWRFGALALALCSAALPAKADRTTPLSLALPATKVMVLGLGHLDGAPENFQTAWLEPVLCRLRAYAPDMVMIEAMPGEQVMMLDSYAAYHGDAGKYAGPTLAIAKAAQAELKLTAGQALREAERLAAAKLSTAAQRRRLAALFAAAAEPFSATVQWMRLAPADRVAGEGVTADLVKRLNQFAGLRNEMTSIAARLAADRGLERLYGTGDHSSDVVQPDFAAFSAAVDATHGLKAQFSHDTPAFRSVREDAMKLAAADEVMPSLKWKNSTRFQILDADAQWFSMLRSPTMGALGRQRVAAWEAQNLHMATTIREATASIPGGRAVLVVGASHKLFVERYLRALSDIEIVSSTEMLAGTPKGCTT